MTDFLASPWPWLPFALGAFVFAWYMERKYGPLEWPLRRWQRRPESPTVCAWCVCRDGDTCTHPASPVSDQACLGAGASLRAAGPICFREAPCEERELQAQF